MKLLKPKRPSTGSKAIPCLLIADIGGTNARFALANPKTPGFSKEITLKCSDYESADSAIKAYLKKVKASAPDVICLAAAGPVIDGRVRFTNNNWSLDKTELENTFNKARVRLLNDFEAIAYSIPHLSPQESIPVGLPEPAELGNTDFMVGIIGPGTGLGTAGLLRNNGRLVPIVGEGGHNGFAPETQVQMDILIKLREQFDRVCDERLVSGPGIENIYKALSSMRGKNTIAITAADIFSRAARKSDEIAQEAVELFFEILGQVAGNLTLTLGAFDGLYIGGGIVARKPELIINSRFRTGFERKGRHRSLMENTPTRVISHPNPGLLGTSYCALQLV